LNLNSNKFDEEELQTKFEEFFWDTFPEFSSFGKLKQFLVDKDFFFLLLKFQFILNLI